MTYDRDGDNGAHDGLPPGTILSDTYEIVRQIGLGGMAEVYRARNIHTDEPVAIKVVLPEFSRDQTNVALFRKEATVLSRLHHDAIVRYHTFTVETTMKRPYLVMEFVDGIALSDFIKQQPLNAADTRTLILRIASGLQVAHDVDVIHRDLSPDNVILPEGKVSKTKIVDFGIAKAGKIGEGTLLGGKFAGKYNFVSPEQLGLAGGEVTGQSDIYSLGLIAAAAQLGKPLDMSGSQLDVLEKRRVVPDLTGLDPAIRPIVTAMLQPLPENRPHTMAGVIAMLDAPAPRMMPDTGTVFGAEMPYQQTAPAPDPWSQGAPTARTIPPQPQAGWPPQAERSMPPQQWPPQNERSVPPQNTWPPQGDRSQPPELSLGTRDPMFGAPAPAAAPGPASTGAPRSESPFGPGPTTAPPTFGKTTRPARQKSGGGGGLLWLLGLLVLIGGGGALFYLQGGFGLLGPTTIVPTTEPPTTTLTTTTAVTPTTVTPTVETEAQTTTVVADIPPTTTTVSPTQVLGGAASRLAWLKDYRLNDCEFAAPTTVADNAMTIEGFGKTARPFEQLMTDFTKDNGFEPEVGVRLILDPQCAVADFLRAVQPLAKAGPQMGLSTDSLPSGGSLQGTITDTEGWTTDLLLVDYRGGVQNLNAFLTPTADGSSFALPPLNSKTSEPVPMMMVAISNKGGLNTTRLVKTHEAKQIFPVILREIQSKASDVSIAVKYFKLGGAAGN